MAERETIRQEGEGSGGKYRAFLLRCWKEPDAGPEGNPAWRFTLVEAGDEEDKQGFASLEDLMNYLRQELAQPT